MKTRPAPSQPARTVSSSRGFTIVELLVVISIIAVLAAVTVPAVSRGVVQARKMEAQTNCMNIVSAMDAYRSDNNGVYPDIDGRGALALTGGDDGIVLDGGATSSTLVEALVGGDDMSTAAENLNGRQTSYLPMKSQNSNGTSGMDLTTYAFVDYWGNAYHVYWDADYDDEVENPLVSNAPAIKRGCIALSQGAASTLALDMTGKDARDVVKSW